MDSCKECPFFYDESGTGNPILDECVCFFPGGEKNYFVDLKPCEEIENEHLH